jgi:hypothetical protein
MLELCWMSPLLPGLLTLLWLIYICFSYIYHLYLYSLDCFLQCGILEVNFIIQITSNFQHFHVLPI